MNTMLLVIDFINEIIHPEGKINSCANYVNEYHVIEKANQAISHARKNNYLIAHVKVGFDKHYQLCPKNSPMFANAEKFKALMLDTWGCEFHQDVDVQEKDLIIIKHRVSALYATSLSTILTANKISHVYLCGVSTNMAIDTTTRELHDRDYQVSIIQDACGAANQEMHQASLATLQRIASIITVDDLG